MAGGSEGALIFDLLERMDDDPDSIISFAGEAGSWQVNVLWDRVLPPYFESLSHTAEPSEWAEAVSHVVDHHVRHDLRRFLEVARARGTDAQVKELEDG